jgi:CubicO group peptidase (beta-lactamase class C family)
MSLMLLSLATSAVLVLLAFTLAASPCVAAPVGRVDDAELRAAMEREIPRLLREGEVPGISIAVIRDSRIAWSGTFGVDPASGAPAGPETRFQAASLTKPVVAYLVLRLADRGVIDLDRPLWSYLPEPRLKRDERAHRITGRHVLSQTTGLPNWGKKRLKTRFEPGERFGGAWRAYVAARRDGSAGLVYFANSHQGLRIARDLAAMAMGGGQAGLDWLGYEGL